ncbi:PKD domain-containing protein [Pedobacter nototheniae]|uniref:PKD domain-containing protein n=1 Tax=Pedobacter nototheniae TaxID=2488994 RepID=UPI00103B77C3|nr:PKD domain-containing protein [Pedobacter nototheniae]
MNSIIDNHLDGEERKGFKNKNTLKVILLTLLIGILLGLIIFGAKLFLPSSNDINAGVSPRTLSTKDSIVFKDSSDFAKKWMWNFGDGNISFSKSGKHRFTKAGNYMVQLKINASYLDTFYVTVKDTALIVPLIDSIAIIEAPKTGLQFENLTFRAIGKGATQYRWKFGETNFIDSKEKFVQYFYKEPGTYTVLLYTDNSEYPIRHKINILPSFKLAEDSLVNVEDVYSKYGVDFKSHLQKIANGEKFNEHYYYLIKKYLCGNEKTVVKINGQKINDFNSYCLGLQFESKLTIQAVKLTPNEEQNCIKMIEVKQSK